MASFDAYYEDLWTGGVRNSLTLSSVQIDAGGAAFIAVSMQTAATISTITWGAVTPTQKDTNVNITNNRQYTYKIESAAGGTNDLVISLSTSVHCGSFSITVQPDSGGTVEEDDYQEDIPDSATSVSLTLGTAAAEFITSDLMRTQSSNASTPEGSETEVHDVNAGGGFRSVGMYETASGATSHGSSWTGNADCSFQAMAWKETGAAGGPEFPPLFPEHGPGAYLRMMREHDASGPMAQDEMRRFRDGDPETVRRLIARFERRAAA